MTLITNELHKLREESYKEESYKYPKNARSYTYFK